MRIRILAATLVALPALGACTSAGVTGSAPYTDTSRLVAAGVARVQWASTSQFADLNITQWSGLDAMAPSETRCRAWSTDRHTVFFDLNWRAVRNRTPVASVTLTISTPDGRPVMIALPDRPCLPMSRYRIGELPPDDGEQYVLQLFAPYASTNHAIGRLLVVVNGRREVLPLVPACSSDRGQSPSRTCTVEPISFDEGAPYSVNWRV